MSEPLKTELITVPLPSTDQLQLSRLYRNKQALGAPVFMVHDLLQDGSSFHPQQGGGLAGFLAAHGYDVYVADLRGRGKSWPQINAKSDFGCYQLINQDIPALVQAIANKRNDQPQIWVGHGWGSVLLCACYARYGEDHAPVSRMIHFGARRQKLGRGSSPGLTKHWLWSKLANFLITLYGYFPASKLRLGTADESRASYNDFLRWSASEKWQDHVDYQFYDQLIAARQLPPSFYFAVDRPGLFGEAADVRRFISELGAHDVRLMVLSRSGGSLRNYSHRQMLQHRDCERDHFPLLLEWLAAG